MPTQQKQKLFTKEELDRHAAFARAHGRGDLSAAVALARDQAKREILSGGVDYDSIDFAEKLAGELERNPDSSVSWDVFCRYVYAAYSMGIATGQLVHPDVFKSGGVR